MELLVVMGLFSMTVLMASDVFLLSNRAQRRVLAITQAQGDIRFALESMVREIRTGRIDYASYAGNGGIAVPANHLIILSAAGSKEDFYVETSNTICPTNIPKCLALSINGGTAQSLTSSSVSIDRLSFYISPAQDPFAQASNGSYGSNIQPTVTIAIQAKTALTAPQDTLVMNAQTTAESRTYAR